MKRAEGILSSRRINIQIQIIVAELAFGIVLFEQGQKIRRAFVAAAQYGGGYGEQLAPMRARIEGGERRFDFWQELHHLGGVLL